VSVKLLSAVATLLAGSAAVAVSAQPQVTQGCDVHVYPADGVHSIGDDFDNVHEVDQGIRHYYAMAGRSLDWLSASRQIEVLRGSSFAAHVSPGAGNITFHSEPLTRRQALELPATNNGECLVDILIPQILLERGALASRSLRIFGIVRRYERGVAVRHYSGYASAPMTGFQLRSPADAPAATQLVESAYVGAIEAMLDNSNRAKN
jgi:hypothetical protein